MHFGMGASVGFELMGSKRKHLKFSKYEMVILTTQFVPMH